MTTRPLCVVLYVLHVAIRTLTEQDQGIRLGALPGLGQVGCMKTITLNSFEGLGPYERRVTGRPRRRFINTRLNAQQVKFGQEYEPTRDQRLRSKREEVRKLRLEQQPTTKQALLYYFLGDPYYATASERNISILKSTGWKYEIVDVDYNTQLREL